MMQAARMMHRWLLHEGSVQRQYFSVYILATDFIHYFDCFCLHVVSTVQVGASFGRRHSNWPETGRHVFFRGRCEDGAITVARDDTMNAGIHTNELWF